jgi:hypothetical protein
MFFDHAMAGIEQAEVLKTIAIAVRDVPADLHGSKRWSAERCRGLLGQRAEETCRAWMGCRHIG